MGILLNMNNNMKQRAKIYKELWTQMNQLSELNEYGSTSWDKGAIAGLKSNIYEILETRFKHN
jgi:hypothetical protein